MRQPPEIEYKENILKIIDIFFPSATVYLFGSRARGDNENTSDIDIAIDIGERMPLTERGQIMSMIDVLNIPQRTDVVDFHAIPAEMQQEILKQGILWKKATKNSPI